MIMYRFNPIHIKITSNFLVDINELIPNIFEKNKVGEFTLTDVKAYHKAEVWPCGNTGRTDTDQWNTENTQEEIHTNMPD